MGIMVIPLMPIEMILVIVMLKLLLLRLVLVVYAFAANGAYGASNSDTGLAGRSAALVTAATGIYDGDSAARCNAACFDAGPTLPVQMLGLLFLKGEGLG